MFRRLLADGIEMRQFAPDESAAVFAVVDRNREYLRQWLPWVDATRSADDVGRFIAEAGEQWNCGRGPTCGIWMDGAFIGSIGTHGVSLADQSGNIGYWIEAGHQGKGTITRCSMVLLDYLFKEMKLHRVAIRCAPGNIRSRAIPLRLGFTCEGILREAQRLNDGWVDLEIWGMLAPDWRKR